MKRKKLSNIALLTFTTAMTSLPAMATVITVDDTGNVNVEEVRDYRQKPKADSTTTSASPEIITSSLEAPQENPDLAPRSPVIAQPVPTVKFPFKTETGEDRILELDRAFLEKLENGPVPNIIDTVDIPKDIPESVTTTGKPKLYAEIIQGEAEKYSKIDVSLIESVIETESNYKLTAISPKGAMGLMQLMPATATRYNVVNAFDPAENIRAGTAELARLFDLYDNPSLVLAAYNAGENAVSKYDGIPPFDETQNYVVKVLSKVFNKRQEISNNAPITQTAASDKSRSFEEVKKSDISKMKVYSFDWP